MTKGRKREHSEANDETMPEYEAPVASPLPELPVEPAPPFDPTQTLSRKRTARVNRLGLIDGRYELEAPISSGGMANVFKARHRDLGRSFAIKVVREGFKEDPQMRAQFFTEARLASSLAHPNIIAVTDYGVDDQLGCFLVMELLEGETLRERMTRQRATLRIGCDVVDQVSNAVRYIHGRGVVHCDVKPENIFLARVPGEPRRANAVKLIDFGLSWRTESIPDPALGGTPPYLAPERLAGGPPSPLCDVYSLGVVLYELIAGRWPYTGTLAQIIDQQLNGARPPKPSQLSMEAVDERADELVMRAIERNPADRQPSCEAFHFELRALMKMMGMRLRRHTLMSEASLQSIGGEELTNSVVESPFALAIFERSGAVRFANRSFSELMEGKGPEEVMRFDDLQAVKRDPALAAALAQAIAGGKPVRRMVLCGQRMYVLVLAPCVRDERVDSVHATLVDTHLD